MSEIASPREMRPYVSFKAQLAREICRRVAQGESVAQICADPAMPAPATVSRWANRRAVFRRALRRAREAAGWAHATSKGPGWKEPTAQPLAAEVFARLCAGEALSRICADPRMPAASTLYRWRRDWTEFDEAMTVARRVQAEALCEKGWDLAEAATPETAYLTHVRLTHLRWMAGVFAPRFCGRLKTQEPEAFAVAGKAPEEDEIVFYARKFERIIGPDGKPTVREVPPEWLNDENAKGDWEEVRRR